MADLKISELPVATAPAGTELIEIVQGGVNKQTTTQDIANLGGGGGGTVESVTGDGVGGTATDPVITLKNGLPSGTTTGTAIAFATPLFYASSASPATGNITLVTTNLVPGMVQILYHNDTLEPSYPAEFVRLSGNYIADETNIIYMHAISATRIEYTISQEI